MWFAATQREEGDVIGGGVAPPPATRSGHARGFRQRFCFTSNSRRSCSRSFPNIPLSQASRRTIDRVLNIDARLQGGTRQAFYFRGLGRRGPHERYVATMEPYIQSRRAGIR